MPLTPALSAYLDCLRFVAALSVLLGHLTQDGFALGWIPLSYLSHHAVVVFFFMSGYIITVSTRSRPGTTATDYAVARLSRVYSVALPAVVFSVLLGLLLGHWEPQLAEQIASWRPFSVADIAASLLFWNESWSSETQLTLNGPYWSLCYEVWYYLVFGLFFFVRGPWRWPLVVLASLVAGPAIMVLFPIWMLGSWMAMNPDSLRAPPAWLAWPVWLLTPLLIWLLYISGYEQALKSLLHNNIPGFWRLEASQRLFTDYLVGLFIAAHLWAWGGLPQWLQAVWQRHARWWAAWAAFSFTLYLFHRPLTSIAGKALGETAQSVPVALLAVVLSLLACWLIAFGTERQLPWWRKQFRKLFARWAPSAVQAQPRG